MQLIFGANGPSGRAFIRTLTNPADTVAVLRKPPEDSFFSEHHIQTTIADALDADALDKVFAQYRPDSVVSFVGGKNEQGIRSDALGNINIIKTEAEIYLKQSSLNWTILRPCGLDNSEDNRHILTDHPDGIPKNYMSRNGLAAAVVAVLQDPDSIGKVYTVGAGS